MSQPEIMEPKVLVPLDQATPRIEAIERCIAPLTALGVIGTLDDFRQSPAYPDLDRLESLGNSLVESAAIKVVGWASAPDSFTQKVAPTPGQAKLFRQYTYEQNIRHTANDSVNHQAKLLSSIILPGVLTVKGEAPTRTNIVDLLRSPELSRICRSMSFSGNGALVLSGAENALLFAQKALRRHQPQDSSSRIDHTLLNPRTAAELFELDADGAAKLSFDAIRILRKYMELDNKEGIVHGPTGGYIDGAPERLRGSRGCPASIKSVRMRPDDLTDEQLLLLTTGVNPIATYDPTQQKFTLLRSPIDELNYIIAGILTQIDNPALNADRRLNLEFAKIIELSTR